MKFDKQMARQNILRKREALSSKEVQEMSKTIVDKLSEINKFNSVKSIFGYIDIRNEVQTRYILNKCINRGQKIFVPKTCKQYSEIDFYEILNIDRDLIPGNYGVFEPIEDEKTKALPETAQIVIVPGVAFDKSLNRIGYGKGYYDKYLSRVSSEALKIGLAYDFQVLDEIPVTGNDIKLDLIITEKKIIGSI